MEKSGMMITPQCWSNLTKPVRKFSRPFVKRPYPKTDHRALLGAGFARKRLF